MKTVVLHEDEKSKVVAFYVNGKLFYTRTYTLDADGFVETDTKVYADGEVITH